MRLEGTTVLLTGASGGLGQALAAALAGQGASLVLTGRRPAELEAAAGRNGGRVVPADLADRDALDALLRDAGPVDVLVANAAVPGSGPLTDYRTDQIDRALDVNLRAPIHLAHALVPGMVARGRGHLLFVSSLAGLAATPDASLYSATKFGLRGFALGLRQDLHGTGVGVSVLLPGFVSDAGMFADSGAELPHWVGARTSAQVAAAAVAVITKDRAEATVAPLPMVLGAYVAGLAPGFTSRVMRVLGGHRLSSSVAAGQRARR